MGIRYDNLDQITRNFMMQEIASGGHYISPRLTTQGQIDWPELMKEAAKGYNDDWLSAQLLNRSLLLNEESYTRNNISRTRRINKEQAAQQLAEGEFNRYYIRGLCLRAISEGIETLIVYRGKEVQDPRPESQAKIGSSVAVDQLLLNLRSNDFVEIEKAFGIPGGPNSGLTCKLP
jgi:hypothetical protein